MKEKTEENPEEKRQVDIKKKVFLRAKGKNLNEKPTCGFTRTRSINSTTKSCSTYLSANRLHRGHCVSRTSPPAPPPCGVVGFAADFASSAPPRAANVEKDEGDVTAAAAAAAAAAAGGKGGVGGETEGVALA